MIGQPQLHPDAFIAPDASVYGDVTIEEDCSIWFHATIRAEDVPVVIGKRTNIQDNAVIHGAAGHPVTIGADVTVGHGAIVHGCKIGDNTMIGMGAILLNGVVVGKNCVIGAGTLVTQNMKIPDNSLLIGSPAKTVRRTTDEEAEANRTNALRYVQKGKEYAAYFV